MSDLFAFLIGSASHLSPSEAAAAVSALEEPGFTLVSLYTANDILYGMFRKTNPWHPSRSPEWPFRPETKALSLNES